MSAPPTTSVPMARCRRDTRSRGGDPITTGTTPHMMRVPPAIAAASSSRSRSYCGPSASMSQEIHAGSSEATIAQFAGPQQWMPGRIGSASINCLKRSRAASAPMGKERSIAPERAGSSRRMRTSVCGSRSRIESRCSVMRSTRPSMRHSKRVSPAGWPAAIIAVASVTGPVACVFTRSVSGGSIFRRVRDPTMAEARSPGGVP